MRDNESRSGNPVSKEDPTKQIEAGETTSLPKQTIYKQQLEAMGITSELITKAVNDKIISKVEQEILEGFLRGMSTAEILEGTGYSEGHSLVSVLDAMLPKIQGTYPAEVTLVPRSREKADISRSEAAGKIVLDRYLALPDKEFSPDSAVSKVDIKLPEPPITMAEIRKAWKNYGKSPLPFAALLLVLDKIHFKEIKEELQLTDKQPISTLCYTAITKIMKVRQAKE